MQPPTTTRNAPQRNVRPGTLFTAVGAGMPEPATTVVPCINAGGAGGAWGAWGENHDFDKTSKTPKWRNATKDHYSKCFFNTF